jgi:predicted RNase H-like nuclease
VGATDRHRVAGIDGYGRGAWVAVLLDGGGFEGALIGRSLDELLPRLDGCSAITIDIPIGLPDGTPREADQLARARLGRRRSSVFPTPPRAVLEAPTFAAANVVARGRFGRGVSLQTYGMRSRIFEAERHVRDGSALIEVHPEVSFAELAGEPLFWAKDSWRGAPLRRQLLSGAGITLADELGEADGVPVPDVLDAAIAAWSATRIARGRSISLPDPPQVHSDGLRASIRA